MDASELTNVCLEVSTPNIASSVSYAAANLSTNPSRGRRSFL